MDPIYPNLLNLGRRAPVVFVGALDHYDGSAKWNTADGSRLKKKDLGQLGVYIYRPVSLVVDRPIRGVDDGAKTLKAKLKGGDIGCDRDHFSDELTLAANTRYVFFLIPPTGTKPNDDPWVMAAWPLGSDGLVPTPADGTISIDDLEAQLAQYVYVP